MKLLQSIKKFLLDIQPEIAELEGNVVVESVKEEVKVEEVKVEVSTPVIETVVESTQLSASVVEENTLKLSNDSLKLSIATLEETINSLKVELESVKSDKVKFEELYNKSTNINLKNVSSGVSQKELVKQLLKRV